MNTCCGAHTHSTLSGDLLAADLPERGSLATDSPPLLDGDQKLIVRRAYCKGVGEQGRRQGPQGAGWGQGEASLIGYLSVSQCHLPRNFPSFFLYYLTRVPIIPLVKIANARAHLKINAIIIYKRSVKSLTLAFVCNKGGLKLGKRCLYRKLLSLSRWNYTLSNTACPRTAIKLK